MTEASQTSTDGKTRWGLMGAVAAAVGASVCCLGPLWMAATLVFLGLAFARVYRKPKEDACAPESTYPPNAGRRNKVLFWIVTLLVLGLLALPYAIPYAYDIP